MARKLGPGRLEVGGVSCLGRCDAAPAVLIGEQTHYGRNAVGYWNAFFNALLYINDTSKWPLQMVIQTYVVNNAPLGGQPPPGEVIPPQQSLQMAVLVISVIPILIVYTLMQRHIVKGVAAGALKG